MTETKAVGEEPEPKSVSNLGSEISSSAFQECTNDEFCMRFEDNLDRRNNRYFMHVPDIQDLTRKDCWLYPMAHDMYLEHRNESGTQIQWSATMDVSNTAAPTTVIDSLNSSSYAGGMSSALDDRSEAQRTGNYDHLQYCIFGEALNMVTQQAFPYGESIPQDPTTPVPFLTTSRPLHGGSNPVWDYWWRHYKI
ncbi:hypothetical protein F5883DRAFT_569953 [Diaporthe sp. PMI_573]|nr:hypothetical protein F5883DRAFT_569953 [Diaporthaceae sp. PMI_573]